MYKFDGSHFWLTNPYVGATIVQYLLQKNDALIMPRRSAAFCSEPLIEPLIL